MLGRRTHADRITPGSAHELCYFELTATLAALGTATATRLVWGGSSLITTGGDTFTVRDAIGYTGVSGDRGQAVFMPDADQWIIKTMPCPCVGPAFFFCDILGSHKLWEISGVYTTSIRDSQSVGGFSNDPSGIHFDGVNAIWASQRGLGTGYLMLQSGHFTSTVKTSLSVSSKLAGDIMNGAAWDGTDTFWARGIAGKLFRNSGQFTSTVRDSQTTSTNVNDLAWDGTNSPFATGGTKAILQSGKFDTTIKTSISDSGRQAYALDYYHGNTPSVDRFNSPYVMYMFSGQFTTTIRDTAAAVGSSGVLAAMQTTDY